MAVVRSLFHLLVEYLLFLPYLLLVGVIMLHTYSVEVWLLSFFAVSLLGFLYKSVLKKTSALIDSLFLIVLGLVLGYVMGTSVSTRVLFMLLYPVFLYRGIMRREAGRESTLSLPVLWVFGFLTYLVGYIAFRSIAELRGYVPFITSSGLVFVIATLFITNSQQLKRSAEAGDASAAVSQSIKRRNTLYLTITAAVILLLTLGGGIQNGVFLLIRRIFHFFAGDGEFEEVVPDGSSGSSDNPDLFFNEIQEPSAFISFLEAALLYSFYALVIVGVLVLLLMLMKKTRDWVVGVFLIIYHFLKKLGQRFKQPEAPQLFTEEKDSIFDFDDWKDAQKQRFSGFQERFLKPKVKWRELSNREQVRYIYHHFVLDAAHDKLKSDTVRETLAKVEPAASFSAEKIALLRQAYEDVRYGDRDITDAEVAKLHDLIEQ